MSSRAARRCCTPDTASAGASRGASAPAKKTSGRRKRASAGRGCRSNEGMRLSRGRMAPRRELRRRRPAAWSQEASTALTISQLADRLDVAPRIACEKPAIRGVGAPRPEWNDQRMQAGRGSCFVAAAMSAAALAVTSAPVATAAASVTPHAVGRPAVHPPTTSRALLQARGFAVVADDASDSSDVTRLLLIVVAAVFVLWLLPSFIAKSIAERRRRKRRDQPFV